MIMRIPHRQARYKTIAPLPRAGRKTMRPRGEFATH